MRQVVLGCLASGATFMLSLPAAAVNIVLTNDDGQPDSGHLGRGFL